MEIPRQYVQQNQHNAFYLFNINGESITSECYLTDPLEMSKCYFEFNDDDKTRHTYSVPFVRLYEIQKPLLEDLKALQKEWLENYPPDGWTSFLHPFRKNTHQALDQLINEIETESLPFRTFITERNYDRQDIPYMYDSELTERVWDIFKFYLDFRSEQSLPHKN